MSGVMRAAVDALAAHSLSTSDETCCSCGLWLGRRDLGPVEMQHQDHMAEEVLAVIHPLIAAEVLRSAADEFDLFDHDHDRALVAAWLDELADGIAPEALR